VWVGGCVGCVWCECVCECVCVCVCVCGVCVRKREMFYGDNFSVRGQLKCDGTRAETRFRLSAKRTSPFKSTGGRQFGRLLPAELCASAVVMLDTTCSEVV